MAPNDRDAVAVGDPDHVDRAVTALANFNRRCVLRYLAESTAETVSMDELTTHIRDSTWTDPATTDEELERRLHHVHLPRLEQAGLIVYDPRTGEVRYLGDDVVESLLTALPDDL